MRLAITRWVLVLAIFTCVLSMAVSSEAVKEEWAARYSAASGLASYATDVATDNAGNVYVTGYSDGGATSGWQIVSIKYDSTGAELWSAIYNGPVIGGADVGNAIVVSIGGSVFVTGSTAQSATGDDVIVLKYTSTGTLAWSTTYTSLGNNDDAGRDITVSGSDDIYITGVANGDYLTLKYDSGGGMWATVLDGGGVTGNNHDEGLAIVYTGSDLYTTGYLQRNLVRKDYWTIKYNTTTGDTIWASIYDRAGGGGKDIAYDITADYLGNIIVTGESGIYPPTHKDCVTIKYSPLGTVLWTAQYDNGGADDWGEAVVTDGSGHAYVAGTSGDDYLVVRHNQSNGLTAWSDHYGNPGQNDHAYDIDVDGGDNVYVIGESNGDYATLMYNSSGSAMWTMRYSAAADAGKAIAVMDSNYVYVTGTSGGDYATIRYSQKASAVVQAPGFKIQLDRGSQISLDQADPEPAQHPGRFLLASYSFESGALPDKQGWTSHDLSGRGDFAGLFFGLTQVQEDPCLENLTYLWAFINGSTEDYGCDGWPGQAAVPYQDIYGQFIKNEIWSPGIPWTGAGSQAELKFDVYRDLTLRAFVFYTWRVRSWVGGIAGPWRDRDLTYYGHGVDLEEFDVDWLKVVQPFGDLIESNADSIQVALGVWDMFDIWSGCYSHIPCHSHAPLFDNVEIHRLVTDGPVFSARDIDLFQDTWPSNGTSIGAGRIDMAQDINPCTDINIRPGDSACVWVDDHEYGLMSPCPYSGFGSAVYLYLARDPRTNPMSGPAAVADWFRWPFVDIMTCNNRIWHIYRCDTVYTEVAGPRTGPVRDRFCVDLNDNYFVNGDTLLFFFGAQNTAGVPAYWSQFTGNTNDILAVCDKPMEMQILPGGGLLADVDILYVDYFDGRGAQPYFDTAFENMNIKVDRYDKRGPSSLANNGLASRVGDIGQIVYNYNKIIWNTGDLPHGNLGDGTGDPVKEDDATLLFMFLDVSDWNKGVYFSGDDLAEEWATLVVGSAITLKDVFIPHGLVSGNHQVTANTNYPRVVGVSGGIFDPSFLGPDTLVAYGGCPIVNDFDVIEPQMTSVLEATYEGTGLPSDGAVISNRTLNSNLGVASVVLSGFSYHYIRDDRPQAVPDRYTHLHRILTFLENIIDDPIGAEGGVKLYNNLAQNHPNPFNPVTTISYSIKERAQVSLKVYNVAGRLVKTLVNEEQIPLVSGYSVTWAGQDNSGNPVSSGVYFYKLVAKNFTQTRKMVLIK